MGHYSGLACLWSVTTKGDGAMIDFNCQGTLEPPGKSLKEESSRSGWPVGVSLRDGFHSLS